ncbi:hypothetical protein H1R17_00735 [Flavobacterium sp. xlx-214]|uniref:DUF6095 family protein n=1 Tax=unclassified Flavobacterium TaxID=196869 RepID=UPI0013D0BD8F|nr:MULTISPECIES: DUF6095 family protein [unclassified Flavobacterium]MBA5794077.1 hypothetical protein [Flavobacterium sp. xlx-221]QMI83702.1 hypothetical protein H1R17_00735 [Flavobacterium sp. xlx-214]
MENKETDKSKIYKGLQKIFFAIPLMFVGPIIINSSFKNPEHFLYYPVLIVGCLVCLFSMYLFFIGLRTLVSGLFND